MAVFKEFVVGVQMPDTHPWDAANLEAPCRLAIRQAFQLADPVRATVHLVCVLPEPTAGLFGSQQAASQASAKDRAEAEAVLADLTQQYTRRSQNVLTVTSTVTFGTAWREILKIAMRQSQTLILCGTQTQSAVSRLLFGSTGQKLLHNAACPVWLVKPRLDEDAVMDILATSDLSTMGDRVLEVSVALGQALPVRLNVLHVIDAAAATDGSMSGQSQLEAAEHRLHEQLANTDYRTLPNGVQTYVTEGPADDRILTAVSDLKINLLVMATNSQGGVSGMLLGNTAERLLPKISCSVLVIKPDNFQPPTDLT